jgi:hypothetical protein
MSVVVTVAGVAEGGRIQSQQRRAVGYRADPYWKG